METTKRDFTNSNQNVPSKGALMIASMLEQGNVGPIGLAFCTMFGLIDKNEAGEAIRAVYGNTRPDFSATAQVLRQMIEFGEINAIQIIFLQEFGILDRKFVDQAYEL